MSETTQTAGEKIPAETIAVIGDSSLRTGFRLAGITQLHPAHTPVEAEALLNQLMTDSTVGIIIIDEKFLDAIDWRLKKKIESAAKPVVVAVPGRNGPLEQSESIAKLVKRALGFDLMKKGKDGNGKNGHGTKS
jgi:V/A-type H+-transporting ATPase subunit F